MGINYLIRNFLSKQKQYQIDLNIYNQLFKDNKKLYEKEVKLLNNLLKQAYKKLSGDYHIKYIILEILNDYFILLNSIYKLYAWDELQDHHYMEVIRKVISNIVIMRNNIQQLIGSLGENKELNEKNINLYKIKMHHVSLNISVLKILKTNKDIFENLKLISKLEI